MSDLLEVFNEFIDWWIYQLAVLSTMSIILTYVLTPFFKKKKSLAMLLATSFSIGISFFLIEPSVLMALVVVIPMIGIFCFEMIIVHIKQRRADRKNSKLN